jgi:ribosome maturation factor RimP
VRLAIHAAAGVSHGDCARVTRIAGDVLDERETDLGSYVLEVSSPGTDRVLKSAREFETFRGRRVRVRTGEGETSVEIVGECAGTADGDAVVLRRDDGEESTLVWSAVKKARLIPDQPESRGVGGKRR